MTDVETFRLPTEASRFDRATLRVWKTWVGYVRPALAAVVVMGLVHLVVGWAAGALGSTNANETPYRFLVRWLDRPAPPLVSPTYEGDVFTASALWWAVIAEFAAAAAAVAAASVVLWRVRRPIAVSILAGAGLVALHLFFARLWTLTPLGTDGRYPIVVSTSTEPSTIQVIVGSTLHNAAADLALWSPVALGAAMGWLVRRRRARQSAG